MSAPRASETRNPLECQQTGKSVVASACQSRLNEKRAEFVAVQP